MIQILLAALISLGAVSQQEAKSLKNNEKAVIEKAAQYNITVTSSGTCIVNAEDNGL